MIMQLLSNEIKGLRPPVISKELYPDLLKFLGFRHVVRQAYGFQLDVKKLDELEKLFLNTWKRFSREIKSSALFSKGNPDDT